MKIELASTEYKRVPALRQMHRFIEHTLMRKLQYCFVLSKEWDKEK